MIDPCLGFDSPCFPFEKELYEVAWKHIKFYAPFNQNLILFVLQLTETDPRDPAKDSNLGFLDMQVDTHLFHYHPIPFFIKSGKAICQIVLIA